MRNFTLFRDSQNREALIDLSAVVGLISTANPKYTSIYLSGHSVPINVEMPIGEVRKKIEMELFEPYREPTIAPRKKRDSSEKEKTDGIGSTSASLGAF